MGISMQDMREIDIIHSMSNLELVQYMQDNLVSRATGGSFDAVLYNVVRTKLLQKKEIQLLLPSWVKTNRTVEQFWAFIKGKFDNYAERRKFIWDEFTSLLNHLESISNTSVKNVIVFDEAFINEQWQKAIERINTDPEAAITSARTLIESVLKFILDKQNIIYNDTIDLPDLYKEVAKTLNLAPEKHQEQIFKQILGGVSGVISGLGALRNKLGDAHGKKITNVKPSARHSEFAVNLAGSTAMFLYRTFKETKN